MFWSIWRVGQGLLRWVEESQKSSDLGGRREWMNKVEGDGRQSVSGGRMREGVVSQLRLN